MRPKLYFVTREITVNKGNVKSKVMGFVSVFGWEKPEVKAAAKYPGFNNIKVHESLARKKG